MAQEKIDFEIIVKDKEDNLITLIFKDEEGIKQVTNDDYIVEIRGL